MTPVLSRDTYWASFNRPYFDEVGVFLFRRQVSKRRSQVNRRSMYQHFSQKVLLCRLVRSTRQRVCLQHGAMFSYRDGPRAKIFARDHVKV